MISYINKFKIPTLLGLGLIVAGITSGVLLVVKDKVFFTQASPNLAPQNITISNIEDTQVTISWQTSTPNPSSVTFGMKNPQEQTVLDDRDTQTPKAYSLHYFTIKNLLPDTTYLFKIISGKFISQVQTFKTAKTASFQNGFGPVIGIVFDGENPLEAGVVYLSISDATAQSAVIKNLGNFLIPISLIRKGDLSDVFQPKIGDVAKLTIISDKGESTVLFKIKPQGTILPPIDLGQSIDLTTSEFPATPLPPSTQELNRFDLNGDKQINAVDYSEMLLNFSKNPKDEQSSTAYKKADLNGDGAVDKKDLDLFVKQINQ